MLSKRGSSVQTFPKTFYGQFLFPDEHHQKREDSLESSRSCCAPKESKHNFYGTRLLPGRCYAGRGRSRRGLRYAQVSRGGFLCDLVYPHFSSFSPPPPS